MAFEFAAAEAAATHHAATGRWIFLETFLLHARQLREFYFGRTDEDRFPDSSIFAEDYSPQWRGLRGGPPVALRRTKEAIDKQLAHIARERADPAVAQDLGAEVSLIQDELRVLWRRLLSTVPTQECRQAFVAALTTKCRELGVPVPPSDAS